MSKGIDLSGLDQFNTANFLEDIEAPAHGKPLMIPVDQIAPDPDQPRREINQEKLTELAASVRERGVKSPISVRAPNAEGIYLINHGERRWRAACEAGLTEVPAFIDDEHSDYDQAIENIQREDLTPLEIALFIERRMGAGDKKGHIAKMLGKTASYVSDHALFFEFSEMIRALYDTGRCRSVQALSLLHRAYKNYPEEVAEFCAGEEEITKAEVRTFVESLKKKNDEAEKAQEAPTVAAPENQEAETTAVETEERETIATPAASEASQAEALETSLPVAPEVPPSGTPAPETSAAPNKEAAVGDSAEAMSERLKAHLDALEACLNEVTDPDLRHDAGERLRKLADQLS